MKHVLLVLAFAVSVAAPPCVARASAADKKMTALDLIALAHRDPARLRPALVTAFTEEAIKNGKAVLGRGEHFIWAVESATRPTLLLDEHPGPLMRKIPGSHTWYAIGTYAVGTSHAFAYRIAGKPFGGSVNVPAYGPDSYLKPGVPMGTVSEKLVHTSKIYDGLRSNYWIYVPAQYNPSTPAALMVYQDGQTYFPRDDDHIRALDTIDNLTYEHKIPVMISVFVSPGDITQAPESPFYKEMDERVKKMPGLGPGGRPRMPQNIVRSVEYDTVSDRYARFLRDELIPEVATKYNIRKDGYSRGISGHSSGGIAAFNVAWQQPDQFSRVLSWIGSFMPLQPEPDYGGQAFPAKIQRDAKRNIRVWLQDGAEDQRTWPLQSLNMANSLKLGGYDFHFSYGIGTHDHAQGSSELPASLIWLWRDYDPNKTEQVYEMEAAEKAKPLFRVRVYNRDHGPTS
ncbi:MAG: alpha/beta hydrolase-fold protein [Acidobacteriota bacterium]